MILQVSNLEEKIGHKTMTAVQKQTIPYVMQGRDVLVKSQTGSGKQRKDDKIIELITYLNII